MSTPMTQEALWNQVLVNDHGCGTCDDGSYWMTTNKVWMEFRVLDAMCGYISNSFHYNALWE